MNLKTARQAVDSGAVPVALQTLYRWHSLGKYPSFIFKVSGKLMVDLDEYALIVEQARDKHVKRSAQVRAVHDE